MFIIEKDGKIKMQSTSEKALPDKQTQAQMKKAGYKIKEVQDKPTTKPRKPKLF